MAEGRFQLPHIIDFCRNETFYLLHTFRILPLDFFVNYFKQFLKAWSLGI